MPESRRSLWQKWVVQPVVQQLTQGTSPHQVALAIAMGLLIGVFPILGSNTLLALLIGIPLRLNQPLLQGFKTVAYPLQWISLLGFYRAGEMMFGVPHVSIHIPTMMERFFTEPGPFFRDYGMTALYGIAVWCLIAPPCVILLYAISKPLVEAIAKKLPAKKTILV
ncbi:hypothetical protein SAMN02745166_03057 [Prosthecobacter debontii]|uniref:DUF2062 domain-containing protein n=1 Tax=Prosthecobacter debontii TaxID=48467 RepID=A0A1T4YE63_9BACT|nr:DUF2062 domain-containing protein [Prosthecobacter debontii]SKB00076.1 hypothetical protein SAMN02745166_03057 [Prosthecobacter debontii]